jgi:glycosyltransferase involved in cell wall biosynthesis
VRQDSIVRVVASARRDSGPGATRNAGAAVARGELLAFLDDDDLWEPAYLAAAVAAAQQGADVVLTAVDELSGGQRRPFKTPTDDLQASDLLLSNPGALGSNLVVTRAAFLSGGGFDPLATPSEDRELVARLLADGARLVSVPTPRVLKRALDDSVSVSARARREGHARVMQRHVDLLGESDAARVRAREIELASLDDDRLSRRMTAAIRLARLGQPRASARVLRRGRRRLGRSLRR